MRGVAVVLSTFALAACASESHHDAAAPARHRTATAPAQTIRKPALPHPRSARRRIDPLRRFVDRHTRLSRRLTEAIREVSALAPTVLCWDTKGWRQVNAAANRGLPRGERVRIAGFADLYRYEIHLAPGVCRTLEPLPRGPGDELVLAEAVGILAHETRHLSESGSNEAATECAGLQKIPDIAVALGLSERRGSRLAERSWRELYPGLPPEYHTPECHPGGALDESPETPQFP